MEGAENRGGGEGVTSRARSRRRAERLAGRHVESLRQSEVTWNTPGTPVLRTISPLSTNPAHTQLSCGGGHYAASLLPPVSHSFVYKHTHVHSRSHVTHAPFNYSPVG